MMHLILGGSASGKSEYAEKEALRLAVNQPLLYLATMKGDDPETLARIDRHVRRRRGMGFVSLEIPYNLDCDRVREGLLTGLISDPVKGEAEAGDRLKRGKALHLQTFSAKGVILLDCVSNLLANQIFDRHAMDYDSDRFCEGILSLREICKDLLIVSNNVHEDGICYDEVTQDYIAQLGLINRRLGRASDRVTEVLAGLPVLLKER